MMSSHCSPAPSACFSGGAIFYLRRLVLLAPVFIRALPTSVAATESLSLQVKCKYPSICIMPKKSKKCINTRYEISVSRGSPKAGSGLSKHMGSMRA
jgi:hypothetical protein